MSKGKLVFNIHIDGARLMVLLSGVLDEEACFNDFQDFMKTKPPINTVTFDFKNLERHNSSGIREWLKNYTGLYSSFKIEYINITLPIMKTISMTPSFAETAELVSFYIPFYCRKCDKETSFLFTQKEIIDGKLPLKTCPDCARSIKIDEIESSYFDCLTNKENAQQ